LGESLPSLPSLSEIEGWLDLLEDAGLAEAEEEEDDAGGLSEEQKLEFGGGLVWRSQLTLFCRSQYCWSKDLNHLLKVGKLIGPSEMSDLIFELIQKTFVVLS